MSSGQPRIDHSTSDGELARAIAAGPNRAAEALLLSRFVRRVYAYGVRHLRDSARADDLAQEVMTAVLTKLRAGEVREPERIGSFILGTARFMARDVRRAERRATEVGSAAAIEQSAAVTPQDPIDREQLAQALATLTERERAVVVMTFMEDYASAAIAQHLRLEPGNVRVIRHRALSRLAQLLGAAELADSDAAEQPKAQGGLR